MIFSKQIFLNQVQAPLTELLDKVGENIIRSWIDGGHALTNSLEKTMKKEVKEVGAKVVASIYLNTYYIYVNEGVEAGRIPFEPGSGKKSSRYIQGLTTYFQLRAGLGLKEAIGAAFATAWKHLHGGMPTDKSRLNFFTKAIEESAEMIDEAITKMFSEILDKAIIEYQSQWKGKIIIPV